MRKIKASTTRHRKPLPAPKSLHIDATPPDAQFLSRRQARTLTGLNLEIIDRAIRDGSLTASKIGRRVVIERMALTAWIRGAQI